MEALTILGLIAAFVTTMSSVPQVIKVIKTKRTKDISLLMYMILITGIILWLIYGVLIKDTPLILANAVSFVFAMIILRYKIKYK